MKYQIRRPPVRIMENVQRDPTTPWKEATGEWRRRVGEAHAERDCFFPLVNCMISVDSPDLSHEQSQGELKATFFIRGTIPRENVRAVVAGSNP